mgnify:CR=1 FL=1
MPENPGPISIRFAPPDALQPALGLFFRDLPTSQRADRIAETLSDTDDGELELARLLIVEATEGIEGVSLVMLQTDGSAFVWAPVTRAIDRRRHIEIADALLSQVRDVCLTENCWLGQALLDDSQQQELADLVRNGFPELARLRFLQRSVRENAPTRSEPNLTAVPFTDDSARERFARIIERTYLDSLDCPELHRLRTGEEALASHALSGALVPSMWNVYSLDGKDVGLVLLGDHPDENACELVYMGLVTEARGRGLGEVLLGDAISRVQKHARETLFLAVDDRNIYAKALYDRCGFIEVSRKVACAWLGHRTSRINH